MRIFTLALLLLAVAAGHASAQVCASVPNYSTGPSSGDGIVSIIPTGINKVVRNVPVELIPAGTAFTPDGSILYVGNSSSNTVSVIRTTDGLVIATVPVGADDCRLVLCGEKEKVTSERIIGRHRLKEMSTVESAPQDMGT